jgi:cell division septation protein DedD
MVPLAAIAITPAHSAPATVKAGIEAWQKGDFAGAVAIWRPLAEAGNADAAFDLAQAYRLGRGVTTDLSAAQMWLTRAAKKGHLDAQVTLGVLLFDTGDQKGAIPWLKAAAEKGEARAELIYGTALFNGDGVPRNPVLGYAFVARSAAQGLSAAKGTLQDLDSVLPPEQRKKGAAIAGIVAKPKTIPVLREASKPPAPSKPVPVAAPVQAAAQGGWRIQLGAFSKRSSAEALFKRWSPELAGKLAVYSSAGAITRLQVGPYASKSAAAAACASLAKRGQACFPVPAK